MNKHYYVQRPTPKELVEIFKPDKECIKHNLGLWKKRRDEILFVVKQELRRIYAATEDEWSREVGQMWVRALMLNELKETERQIFQLNRVMRQSQNPSDLGEIKWEERIQRVREIEIENLLEEPIRKAGRLKVALCPLHEEKTPSFTLFPDGKFKCFGCGEFGDVISFLMKREQMSFKEIIEKYG